MGTQSDYEQTTLIPVVKTYPTPSKQYIETSCCAALLPDGRLVRVFPVPHRLMEADRQFAKWEAIGAKIARSDDPRPDSYRIDPVSIFRLNARIDTSDGWRERRALLAPHSDMTLCELQQTRKQTGRSLGVVRPHRITDCKFLMRRQPGWTPDERAKLAQHNVFGPTHPSDLNKLPFDMKYCFVCAESGCRGHELSVHDWELGAFYYHQIRKRPADVFAYTLKHFGEHMVHDFDLQFIVGTLKAHQDSWIIVGLFYPPKVEQLALV